MTRGLGAFIRSLSRENAISSEIEDALVVARADWPDIAVSDEVFLGYLRDRLPFGTKGAHLSDLYLACACALGNLRAIAHFEERFLSSLRRTLLRLEPTDDFVEEVRQSLMEHWFVPDRNRRMRISEYSGRGPLRYWVRAAALCTALNLRRKGRLEVAAGNQLLLEAAGWVEDSELAFLRKRYRGELETALTKALSGLSARERNVLRLHYLGGMTYEQLSSVYRVHRATVARWLASSREAIVVHLNQLLASRLGLSKLELESLLRLVRSHLEISLPRILADSGTPDARCRQPSGLSQLVPVAEDPADRS